MADALAGFDPDQFRTQIVATMTMGLPENVDERPTFYFPSALTYPDGTVLDSEGKPIDPRITPTITPSSATVQVPCAVEFAADTTDDEALVGSFRETRVVLTLLDDQYALIEDAIEVNLGTRRYIIEYPEPPIGLGTVTVYRLHCFPKGV